MLIITKKIQYTRILKINYLLKSTSFTFAIKKYKRWGYVVCIVLVVVFSTSPPPKERFVFVQMQWYISELDVIHLLELY
uniref:Uncharacterized protein n=1 Tax=Rhizophora mucronata TaxID=61149 RepID=A0A2P2NFY1_RHIMU